MGVLHSPQWKESWRLNWSLKSISTMYHDQAIMQRFYNKSKHKSIDICKHECYNWLQSITIMQQDITTEFESNYTDDVQVMRYLLQNVKGISPVSGGDMEDQLVPEYIPLSPEDEGTVA